MKLLIISNMSHYYREDQIVGWGPTVQEIDALATIFDEITHIGCLHQVTAPLSALPYHAKNIHFVPLPPAGGESINKKFEILAYIPQYLRIITHWLPWADVVHLRCPANVSLIALLALMFRSGPKYRWVKYAGNWHPQRHEAWSYTFQRWILQKNFHHGTVTVNGKWPKQPEHIFSFYNPCIFQEELMKARLAAQTKHLTPPYRFLYVGRVENAKGVGHIIEIAKRLQLSGIDFLIELVGDGPMRPSFEELVIREGVNENVHFLGWKARDELGEIYGRAHFFLLPSLSEGWPKVLSEGMAYGVVPLASAVSSIPQILADCGCGRVAAPDDINAYCQFIKEYIANPDYWDKEKDAGLNSACNFTYDHYLQTLENMMGKVWGFDL
jgi:glycosyltransferase involved in cell wall biosynthesis